jgi:hypothetical protein
MQVRVITDIRHAENHLLSVDCSLKPQRRKLSMCCLPVEISELTFVDLVFSMFTVVKARRPSTNWPVPLSNERFENRL